MTPNMFLGIPSPDCSVSESAAGTMWNSSFSLQQTSPLGFVISAPDLTLLPSPRLWVTESSISPLPSPWQKKPHFVSFCCQILLTLSLAYVFDQACWSTFIFFLPCPHPYITGTCRGQTRTDPWEDILCESYELFQTLFCFPHLCTLIPHKSGPNGQQFKKDYI